MGAGVQQRERDARGAVGDGGAERREAHLWVAVVERRVRSQQQQPANHALRERVPEHVAPRDDVAQSGRAVRRLHVRLVRARETVREVLVKLLPFVFFSLCKARERVGFWPKHVSLFGRCSKCPREPPRDRARRIELSIDRHSPCTRVHALSQILSQVGSSHILSFGRGREVAMYILPFPFLLVGLVAVVDSHAPSQHQSFDLRVHECMLERERERERHVRIQKIKKRTETPLE